MSDTGRNAVSEFVDEPRPPIDPGRYVLRWRWYYPTLFGGTAGLFATLRVVANSFPGLLVMVIVGTLIGLVMTLAAMAWAVAIVFADDTRRGLWFVIFPPYMPVYAARRWQWMAQPTVLFLCGLALMAATILMTQHVASNLAAPRPYESQGQIRDERFLESIAGSRSRFLRRGRDFADVRFGFESQDELKVHDCDFKVARASRHGSTASGFVAAFANRRSSSARCHCGTSFAETCFGRLSQICSIKSRRSPTLSRSSLSLSMAIDMGHSCDSVSFRTHRQVMGR